MVTYKEAQQILFDQARSFGKEKLPLEQAAGRILSEHIHADRDYPPFNRAAMDGYAFQLHQFRKGTREFIIADTIYAGHTPTHSLSEGSCYKIMTGAAVPADADVIVRREDTAESAGSVKILTDAFEPFQNIARQGEDLKKGTAVITEPIICTPSVISLLAVTGKEVITAERKPQIAIITTGNEVKPVGSDISPVQIRNSNLWLLKALLSGHQVIPFSAVHVQDDKALLKEAFEKVLHADIIISCGSVSAGDTDFIPSVLADLGVETLFHKVAIRPGKPVMCGKKKDGPIVFALPGNPFSCLVTFTIFIQHYLLACYGLQPVTPMRLPMQGTRKKKTNLDEFFPVQVVKESAMLKLLTFNGSGDIQAALFAEGIGIHPAATPVIENGHAVDYLQL
jgi:molybdopterin molybdotransferase